MKRTLGVVLAGGAGSRMGGGKVRADLHGEPLIAYPLAAIAEAGLEALVCAKPGDQLPALEVPVLREPEQPRHPLCGIVAALRAGEGRPLVVVACDLPFVPAGLIRLLAELPDPLVVPSLGGRPQPLLARYETALLPELEAALEGQEPLTRTVEALHPRLLEEDELSRFGDPHRLLFNVNDPADLRQAEALF
ncbi:MAG TPA: molybdenum cofactor guanylyltransferase [Solirubrobacterales bacterium]|nr:molybdenum cofactor guanylyltransferase [Solirubrobacterales bacterium]